MAIGHDKGKTEYSYAVNVEISDIVRASLLIKTWQNLSHLSQSTCDLGVELSDDDMSGDGSGDQDQEGELEEGQQGREGGPG